MGSVEAEALNKSLRMSMNLTEGEFDLGDSDVIAKVKKLVDLIEFLSERGQKSGEVLALQEAEISDLRSQFLKLVKSCYPRSSLLEIERLYFKDVKLLIRKQSQSLDRHPAEIKDFGFLADYEVEKRSQRSPRRSESSSPKKELRPDSEKMEQSPVLLNRSKLMGYSKAMKPSNV